MADPKIAFYNNFSVLLNSGVPILRAIPTAGRIARGRLRRAVIRMEEDVRNGKTIADSMEGRGRAFDPLETELVRTGEETGQLSEILAEMARWCEFRQRMRKIFWSGMLLPLLVLHLAAVVLNLPAILSALFLSEGTLTEALLKVLLFLACIYIPGIGIIGIVKFTPPRGPLRVLLDTFIHTLPIFGKAVSDLSLSRYSKTFSMLYGAGVPILRAAEQATKNCGNWIMYKKLQGGYDKAQEGRNMSEGFSRSLDPEFREVWLVGEETGELDKSSARLGVLYADRAEHSFSMMAKHIPILIYIVIIIILAYLVFRGFMSIYGGILKGIE